MESSNQDLEVVKVDNDEDASIHEEQQHLKLDMTGDPEQHPDSSNDMLLFRNQFFHPNSTTTAGMLLRHHQEQQIKFQQHQLLSHWFQRTEPQQSHAEPSLLKDGTCQWPGCEKSQFANEAIFKQHLNAEHSLSQCSAAQAKVQLQIVAQLEQSLIRERERFHAMMTHLNTGRALNCGDHSESTSICKSTCEESPPFALELKKTSELLKSPAYESSSKVLDTETVTEIMRNREFYRLNDVRPPYTYASLIRQAIVESTHRQLTLNEIYTWFQDNFAYFRRNAATWKNAIRTNLSLHKCFVRYEDDFGSFWTVDDREFLKRRHLSRGRPRKYDPSTGKFESLQQSGSETPPLQTTSCVTANTTSTTPATATVAATSPINAMANFIDFTRLIATSNHAFTT